MRRSDLAAVGQTPSSVREIGPALASGAASGEESAWLRALLVGGVAAPKGALVLLTDDGSVERLREAAGGLVSSGASILFRPLLSEFASARRYEAHAGVLRGVKSAEEIDAQVESMLVALRDTDLRSGSSGVWIRVLAADGTLGGMAASADPHEGDPDVLAVSTYAGRSSEWRIDRRTMQILKEGSSEVTSALAADAADLVDRAQLILGRPIEIEWCVSVSDRRPMLVSLRPLHFRPSFTRGVFRRVALVSADEGTTSPLAIDALDRALSRDDAPGEELRVARIYARAYRRMDGASASRPVARDAATFGRAAAHAARVVADFAVPLSAARSFERGLGPRLRKLDRADLGQMSNTELIGALRRREALVVEALALLDREREATLACLAAVSAVVGPLPHESYHALGAIRPTRARRRAHDVLSGLADDILRELGELRPFSELPAPIRRRWLAAKEQVGQIRALGIDVRPQPFGHDDFAFMSALQASLRREDAFAERERRRTARRLRVTARSRSLGRSREALLSGLTTLLSRLAFAKGRTAEGLAEAYLRLRGAACEAGRRLVDDAILDRPDDGLYLRFSEIEEALAGEPGAYAARVRLRREDDARWADYEAPRRIQGSDF